MKRIRLGIFMGDEEYRDRFTSYLAHHYRQQLELHLYSEYGAMQDDAKELDLLIASDCFDQLLAQSQIQIDEYRSIMYLYDSLEERPEIGVEGVHWVEKYQEVNKIVDEIMGLIGEEIKWFQKEGGMPIKPQIYGVYSLSDNEYQLPLSMMISSIISENQKVLLLDLQENSGLAQVSLDAEEAGLEELLIMTESGKYSPSRLISCIGHLGKVDYIYPARNSECLSEANGAAYLRLIRILSKERGYHSVIINLGTRFAGFFELLSESQEIYLLQRQSGILHWRQKEFEKELNKHQLKHVIQHLHEVEIPNVPNSSITYESLVEQWKWNEFGDYMRQIVPSNFAGYEIA